MSKEKAKVEGVITDMVRRKIHTYRKLDEAAMLGPREKKEYEKLRKLYPSMFVSDVNLLVQEHNDLKRPRIYNKWKEGEAKWKLFRSEKATHNVG
tara:strand:+ start:202 stop:486 length:285 start_codon:yes stop_codon:yes gene_type:complete